MKRVKKELKKELNPLLAILVSELRENAVCNAEAASLLNTFDSQEGVDESFYQQARNLLSTLRNRNLISSDQQHFLHNQVVGFFGLSVGSHAAITWIMESRAKAIKIIDPDVISPTNLNRLRVGWEAVGLLKTTVVAEELQKISPDLKIFPQTTVDPESIKKLFSQAPRLTAVVDAIDDFEGKFLLRQLAKKYKLPLISAADVGDNVTLDVERYDHEPQPSFFNGRLPNVDTIDFKKLSTIERKKLIISLVGFEHNSLALLDSLLSLGKTLTTWPQLGATASITGGVIATTLKKIFGQEKILSGRYYVSLDELLVKDNNSDQNHRERREKIQRIKNKFKL